VAGAVQGAKPAVSEGVKAAVKETTSVVPRGPGAAATTVVRAPAQAPVGARSEERRSSSTNPFDALDADAGAQYPRLGGQDAANVDAPKPKPKSRGLFGFF
jgi:hypothetical protein